MNDSFRSMVFIKYQPETIACACIFLAARQIQIPLPNSPPWYSIFNVAYEEIVDTCVQILRLYTRPKPNVDHLEKVVNEAKKLHVEAKLKAKGLASEGATPNSRPVSPGMGGKASPASTLGVPAIKKIKMEDGGSDSSTGGRHGEYNHTRHGRKRTHSRSRSNSKSRSYQSSSGSRSGSRSPNNRRHTSSKKHKKDSYYSNNSSSTKDKYADRYQDKHAGSDGRYADKYSDRYYDNKHDTKYSSSSGKYDPKYDAYKYRDYKDKEHQSSSSHAVAAKDYRDSSGKDHKHSSGGGSKHHRDVSYSPNVGRGDRAWSRSPSDRPSRNYKKSGYKDKHRPSPRSRSRSPVSHDRHRSSKKHNGRSKDRYSSRR